MAILCLFYFKKIICISNGDKYLESTLVVFVLLCF